MNYKEKLLTYIEEAKANGLAYYEKEDFLTDSFIKAYDLAYEILKTRFENELKQYNNNEKKAYDEFIARKNLDYLRIYIEEFLLLDKTEEQISFYKYVQTDMRNLLNAIYVEMMN